jgi:predicted nucleotidyltransferase
MNEIQLKQKVDELVEFLVDNLKRKLGGRLETITLVGSYVVGKLSIDRPDINMVLIFKNYATPKDLIDLGKVLHDTVGKFREFFSVRLEYRPYRFVYPAQRRGHEVFVNPLILNLAEKDFEFPFNLPHWVLGGMREVQKVVHGTDVLRDLDLDLTTERVIGGGFRELPFIKIHLDRAPLGYDISKDTDLFFNESLAQGKLTAYDGVEIAMSESELKQKAYVEIIMDKEKLKSFYQERYDSDAAEYMKTLIEARENYSKWKNNEERAVEVFIAACGIWQKIWQKLLSKARGEKE